MCITFLFCNPGDCSIKYKLVLINNRDEFYARETQNATLFEDDDLISIFGTDLAGAVKGTWLGISEKNGRIKLGNLANVTGNEVHGKLGRGPIVTNWIKGDETIDVYNKKLVDLSDQFSSFNFLSVEINQSDDIQTFYVSNTPEAIKKVTAGYLGVGNSPMTAPFKKVEAGTEEFKEILENHKECSREELINSLLSVLKNKTKHFPDDELTSRKHDDAEALSSIHVDLSAFGYGTRTRTVILVDNDNNIDYVEETMTTEDPNGAWERTHLKLPKISQL